MAKGHQSGKLAVIVHADVADSTVLVQRNEHLAHERIQGTFNRFGQTIMQYSGRILELRGDAMLAEFERPSDAVSATLAFQSRHSQYLASITDGIKPEIRVGISMGEVVIADNTVTGAGVVLAQRVEQLAIPGGLCITAAIHEALPLRLPFEQEDLGDQMLKGFAEQVRVYRVKLVSGEAIPPPAGATEKTFPVNRKTVGISLATIVITLLMMAYFLKEKFEEPVVASVDEQIQPVKAENVSIVVLPFTNMSNDSEQEYFVDGMTEDLITDLSKISALTVTSRMSSFSYKGQTPDVRSVAMELGVSHLVEGSVRKSGNNVRISAQLVDANGAHIWADRYDRELKDIFALQDEVRSKIIDALSVELTPAEEERLARPLTKSVEAYEVYLQGLQQISFFNREANLVSQEMFRQAIKLDPEFAAAYSYLAQAYSLAIENGWIENREEFIKLAVATAYQGINVDPELPFAYWSLGRIYSRSYLSDMQKSMAAFEKSIELDPNYADGYVMLGSAQIFVGEAEKALENIKKGMRINPHYPFWYIHTLGQAQFATSRYEEAEENFIKAIERNPAVSWPRMWLIATYGQLGKLDDAAWEISELDGLGQPISIQDLKDRFSLQDSEIRIRLLDGARKAGVAEN